MDLVERAKAILFKPKEEWPRIQAETTTIPELYRNYAIILAAIGPLAFLIGMLRFSIQNAVVVAVVQYVLSLVGVYVLALIINALAPAFKGEKNITQAVKVSVYSSTPGWLAGIFAIHPALWLLRVLGLYGLYLLYLGLPVLMKSPAEKSLGYTVAAIVAAVIIFILIGALSSAFISYPMTGPHI